MTRSVDSTGMPEPSPRALIDRVRDRVAAAGAAVAEEARSAGGPSPEQRREALRRVFRELGAAQREQRRRSGQPPFPLVREAAIAFRRAPSLTSLTAVAASLDDVGLLGW